MFSKLDLKWGFHQVELAEGSREITTFVTHRGLYRYFRLMFGIASAPENYQKIVKDVLRDCKGVVNIADDVIVHQRGVKEHDKNLFALLNGLKECGLTLNGSKCKFKLKGITPSEEKIDAIVNTQSPKNASEVRSFLGLVQYSAKFLPRWPNH